MQNGSLTDGEGHVQDSEPVAIAHAFEPAGRPRFPPRCRKRRATVNSDPRFSQWHVLAKGPSGPVALLLIGLSLCFTLLNACKPMQVDDTAYHYYAVQIAEHPLDPYGFQIFWYDGIVPADEVLAPPVVPYWISLAVKIFGDEPFLWKLWQWPFALLFVVSVYVLARRFARGFEWGLLIYLLFSPTFLPSMNLMLDIPALALSLFALVVFIQACEGRSIGFALLAGVVAGLAMQTKYTAFLAPLSIVLYGFWFKRWKEAFVATALSILMFAGWEWLMALRYGKSHFLFHVHQSDATLWDRATLTFPLLGVLGATSPALALLGLHALNVRLRTLVITGSALLAGFLLVGTIPSPYRTIRWHLAGYSDQVRLEDGVFDSAGTLVLAVAAVILLRLCRLRSGWRRHLQAGRHTKEWFLLSWLAAEIGGYFTLSPFPAVRRTMGIVVVTTLLVGRLASLTCRARARRRLNWGIVLAGTLLGAVFYGIDVRDAYAQKQLVAKAAEFLNKKEGGTIWYVGHWGFQYYAERAGMRPVEPGVSRLRAGDWLVVPGETIHRQGMPLEEVPLRRIREFKVDDSVALRTVGCFYAGRVPLEYREGPRLTVAIYQVIHDCAPGASP